LWKVHHDSIQNVTRRCLAGALFIEMPDIFEENVVKFFLGLGIFIIVITPL